MQRLLLLFVLVCTVLVLSLLYSPKSSPLEAQESDWEILEDLFYAPTPTPIPTPTSTVTPTPAPTFDYESLLPPSQSPQVEFARREGLLTLFAKACVAGTLPGFQAGYMSQRWTHDGKPLGWMGTLGGRTWWEKQFPTDEWTWPDHSSGWVTSSLQAWTQVSVDYDDLDFGLYCLSVSPNIEVRLKCIDEEGCDGVEAIHLPPGNTLIVVDDKVAPHEFTGYRPAVRYVDCEGDCGPGWVTGVKYRLPFSKDIRDYRNGIFSGGNTWVAPCSEQ